jgi:putative endonuclease
MFVYVLRSLRDGKRYVGLSGDIRQRLVEHNGGRVDSTRGRRPFELIHTEELNTLGEARAREKYLKSAAGRQFLKKLGK